MLAQSSDSSRLEPVRQETDPAAVGAERIRVVAATVFPCHREHRTGSRSPVRHPAMPYIRAANEHVSPVQWHAQAFAMASLQNEPRVFVESFVGPGDYIDCSVLHNRVDHRNVGDHEAARKRPVNVVVLSMASGEIEVTADVGHPDDLWMQLLHQVDDAAFLQGVVGKPRTRTRKTVEMAAHQAAAGKQGPGPGGSVEFLG